MNGHRFGYRTLVYSELFYFIFLAFRLEFSKHLSAIFDMNLTVIQKFIYYKGSI